MQKPQICKDTESVQRDAEVLLVVNWFGQVIDGQGAIHTPISGAECADILQQTSQSKSQQSAVQG